VSEDAAFDSEFKNRPQAGKPELIRVKLLELLTRSSVQRARITDVEARINRFSEYMRKWLSPSDKQRTR
jgi:hypothetical protein